MLSTWAGFELVYHAISPHFRVDFPQPEVLELHRHHSALEGITPPPILMRMQEAPDRLTDGDMMKFTTWLGPLPLRWHSRIEDVNDTGFTDRQITGPFTKWVHRHDFLPYGEDQTEVRDHIEYAIRPHPIWGPIGLGMALGLPLLFAFRAWKTRRLLELP